MRIEELENYGIDYKGGIVRCANDESIYMRLLAAFLRDTSMARAKAAYDEGDYAAMFSSLHELKGACGNAAMPRLYDVVSRLVDTLRGGNFSADDVKGQFAMVASQYDIAREGVSRMLG